MSAEQLPLPYIPHAVAGEIVSQRKHDGYINATAMCKAAGKKFGDYLRIGPTRAFLLELASATGIPATELIQTLSGGNPELQGSWVHPQVAINLATWASPKFAVLVSKWVSDWMSGAGSPAGKFDKWHERLALNYQSAPKGFFHVFNEANTVIYELICAGAPIGEKMVVDISVGLHWSAHWENQGLSVQFGERAKYAHRYPDSHPQAKSNPQTSWCYPLTALGYYRMWLQDEYIEGGKFTSYLKQKVAKKELTSSVALAAIKAIVPPLLPAP